MDRFYVIYEVAGKGMFEAGPYREDEVFTHYRDIRGYAYVRLCYICNESLQERSATEQKAWDEMWSKPFDYPERL